MIRSLTLRCSQKENWQAAIFEPCSIRRQRIPQQTRGHCGRTGDLLYRVSPRDPLAYGLALAVMTAASLAACGLPAWRATRTDPMHALRE